MKEFDPLMFLAVFEEMLGLWLWVFLVGGAFGAVAFIVLLLRERRVIARRLVQSEILGLFGGVCALVIMAKVSSSGFMDAGGPVDWLLIGVVYGMGLVVTTLLAYTAIGWWSRRGAA